MKKLFTAIRQGDVETVTALLDKKPELVACTAKAPPKKDLGQSPLQVAIKTCSYEIANLLLDRGADVNFIEAEDCGTDFRMPVVQDAVRGAILSVAHAEQKSLDDAYLLLKRMVDMGADLSQETSTGVNAFAGAVGDARQVLPAFNHMEKAYAEGSRPLKPKTTAQLNRVFALIMSAAPELTQHWIAPDSKETLMLQILLDNGGCRYKAMTYDFERKRWMP